ncbi:DctP family TRAP transporter solute-binding subunit [Nitratireductor sp. XY-223]|uniref:DctP family TRAP transporter solute-binding subunit n=1 Tax=Nitratireductor sp. XY-223 TaxID=2561926 RepID=UPI00145B7021|nr:DctP family TRAP transporter solute-binding subunit [Nitratireductor sp. XY-223]
MRNLLTFTAIAVGLLSASGAAAESRLVKIGHGVPETATLHLGLEKFAELATEYSNDTLEFRIFPNQQLGGDRELIEGLQFESVDITAVSGTNLAPFASEFFAFDVFFMFDDHAHADRTFDGPAGQKLLTYLEPIGIHGLGFMENGFRSMTNSRGPVEGVDDIAGLKIRVAENPVQIAAWSALGANPTPMAWGELFTGLQQKTVDAQETSIELIESQRFYEAQTDMTISQHTYTPFVFLSSLGFYSSLTDEQRAAIDKAAPEAIAYQRELARAKEQEALDAIKASGLRVVELSSEAKNAMKALLGEANEMAKERAGEAYDVLVGGAEEARSQ